jgi:hypothetical protein
MTERLFRLAMTFESGLRPAFVAAADDTDRPDCPTCHTRMLADPAPRLPIVPPTDGLTRHPWRCSWCYRTVVTPPYPKATP